MQFVMAPVMNCLCAATCPTELFSFELNSPTEDQLSTVFDGISLWYSTVDLYNWECLAETISLATAEDDWKLIRSRYRHLLPKLHPWFAVTREKVVPDQTGEWQV
jgi:hypothetical protein